MNQNNLSLEAMAQLGSGQDFWHLKSVPSLQLKAIRLSDGPHGLRKQKGPSDAMGICDSTISTCFPTASALACSWDENLLTMVGKALGQLCVDEDVDVLLGPGVNLKRTPLCGRNFEYYSEDPVVSGRLGAAFIKGVQSQGVGTCVKHFAVNNQERNRMTSNSIVDERTLRELYLLAFEIIIKESQPTAVMSAYNQVNGVYASENITLLNNILRNEWGFDGVVISDWGAVNNRVASIKAGMDIEMPGSCFENDETVIQAIKTNQLDSKVLEASSNRIVSFIKKMSQPKPNLQIDKMALNTHELAKHASLESIVLLKNKDDVLPFSKVDTEILIVGALAKFPKIQGAGSSLVNTDNIAIPLSAYESKFGVRANFCMGYNDLLSIDNQKKLILEACQKATQATKVVTFLGLPDDYESEGFDRTHMRLPDIQNNLVEALLKCGKPIVVVLVNGAPVEMPWLSKVHGVLETYLGGESWGEAIWDIIYGDTNPSGKLTETFPITASDAPYAFTDNSFGKSVPYIEALYMGYRYYEAFHKPVCFPFGHGLSYTTFAYENITLEHLPDNDVYVSFDLMNTGTHYGKEIVQCYVSDVVSSYYQPLKTLKAFTKVDLDAGEIKRVTLHLKKRDFSFYHKEKKMWFLETGDFKILIGASSADIRLVGNLHMKGDGICHDNDSEPKSYACPSKPLTLYDFVALLRKPIETKTTLSHYHKNNTLEDLQNTFWGRLLYKVIYQFAKTFVIRGNTKQLPMLKSMILEMPIRNATMASSGRIKGKHIKLFLMLINEGVLKIIKKLLK